MNNKRILWLCHEGSLSGANICLLEYLSILSEIGFEQEVVLPMHGSMADKAKSFTTHQHIIPFYSWTSTVSSSPSPLLSRIRKWLRNKIAVYQLVKLLSQVRPDYIVTNTITTPVAAMAAKRCGIKHFWFVHEFGEEDHGFIINGKFSRGAKVINCLSSKVIFNSNAILKKFNAFVEISKQYMVYNAVDIHCNKIASLSLNGTFKLVMLGQITPAKNHLIALSAIKLCKDKGYNIELLLVGKTEGDAYINIINEFIITNNMYKQVTIGAPTEKPQFVLQQNHALLMCSKMEAFGRVTVEALKCGIPVIAANSGGSLEIVEDGVNGYLYKSGDVESLAEKIIQLYTHYLDFNRESIATSMNDKYNIEKTRDQLLNVFN